MIRILIVDDQNLVQQGIKSLLDRDMDFKVIGTVKDGRNAVQQIAQIHPDIVLLDIEMPGMDGITTTKYIARVSPKTKVIILSSHEEKKYVTRALMAGAKGYILKTSLMTDLKQAILSVNNGYSQIDSRLLAKVFDPQNVRSRKNPLEKKSNVATQNNSASQDSQKSLSHQNDNAEKEVESKYKNSIDPQKDSNTPSSLRTEKGETYEFATSESETAISSEKSTAVSPEKREWKSEDKTLSNGVSDSVVLEQVNLKEGGVELNKRQKQSSQINSQTALATIKQESFEEQPKSANCKSLPKQETESIINRVERLLDNPRVSVYKSQINQFVSQLRRYKIKLLSTIKRKRKRDLLLNIILVVLVIVVVIILGS